MTEELNDLIQQVHAELKDFALAWFASARQLDENEFKRRVESLDSKIELLIEVADDPDNSEFMTECSEELADISIYFDKLKASCK